MAFQLKKEQLHTNGLIGATFPDKRDDDPLNWGKVAAGLAGSHVEDVKAMATTFSCREVVLQGAGLSVAQVAAIARRPNDVHVVLDAHTAKARVDESSNWVLSCAMKGTDTYGVTTGTKTIPKPPNRLPNPNRMAASPIRTITRLGSSSGVNVWSLANNGWFHRKTEHLSETEEWNWEWFL